MLDHHNHLVLILLLFGSYYQISFYHHHHCYQTHTLTPHLHVFSFIILIIDFYIKLCKLYIISYLNFSNDNVLQSFRQIFWTLYFAPLPAFEAGSTKKYDSFSIISPDEGNRISFRRAVFKKTWDDRHYPECQSKRLPVIRNKIKALLFIRSDLPANF
jgi:hypothetical protein